MPSACDCPPERRADRQGAASVARRRSRLLAVAGRAGARRPGTTRSRAGNPAGRGDGIHAVDTSAYGATASRMWKPSCNSGPLPRRKRAHLEASVGPGGACGRKSWGDGMAGLPPSPPDPPDASKWAWGGPVLDEEVGPFWTRITKRRPVAARSARTSRSRLPEGTPRQQPVAQSA
jgi:hypothetical protein